MATGATRRFRYSLIGPTRAIDCVEGYSSLMGIDDFGTNQTSADSKEGGRLGLGGVQQGIASSLLRLRHNCALRHAHLNVVAPTPPRRRGDIDLDLATAKAKMAEFETLEETLEALTPNEKRALLSDAQGFGRLLAMSAI